MTSLSTSLCLITLYNLSDFINACKVIECVIWVCAHLLSSLEEAVFCLGPLLGWIIYVTFFSFRDHYRWFCKKQSSIGYCNDILVISDENMTKIFIHKLLIQFQTGRLMLAKLSCMWIQVFLQRFDFLVRMPEILPSPLWFRHLYNFII